MSHTGHDRSDRLEVAAWAPPGGQKPVSCLDLMTHRSGSHSPLHRALALRRQLRWEPCRRSTKRAPGFHCRMARRARRWPSRSRRLAWARVRDSEVLAAFAESGPSGRAVMQFGEPLEENQEAQER